MHTIRFKGLLRELQGEREKVAERLDTLDHMIHTVEAWEKVKLVVVHAPARRASPEPSRPMTKPGKMRKRYQCICSNTRCPRQGKPFMSVRPQKPGKRRFCSDACSGWTWYAENRRPKSAEVKERSGVPYGGPPKTRATTLVKGDPLTAGGHKV